MRLQHAFTTSLRYAAVQFKNGKYVSLFDNPANHPYQTRCDHASNIWRLKYQQKWNMLINLTIKIVKLYYFSWWDGHLKFKIKVTSSQCRFEYYYDSGLNKQKSTKTNSNFNIRYNNRRIWYVLDHTDCHYRKLVNVKKPYEEIKTTAELILRAWSVI